MLIGHIPSGYILSRLLADRLTEVNVDLRLLLITGIAGAIAPDLDWVYYFLAHQPGELHHEYWTHYPLVWTSALLLFYAWHRRAPSNPSAFLGMVFSAGGLLHLLLDSIVGNILWLAPFSSGTFALFSVEETLVPWWINYVLHWTFSLEVMLTLWAVWLWRRKPVTQPV